MSYLVDSNVLLRSAETGHPLNPVAKNAITKLIAAGERVVIVPQNLYEFWSVCTRPIASNGLGWTPVQTETELAALEALLPLLPDTADIYSEWRRLVVAHVVVGLRAHDTRLVAAMVVHGLDHILTFNISDFTRYPGITAVDPATV